MQKRTSNTHSYHLANFLGAIKVAQQKKKPICTYWPCSKFLISVITTLRDEGYIYGFSLQPYRNSYKLVVNLKYYVSTVNPLISSLTLYASPSRQYNLSYRRLVVLTRGKTHSYFLSTIFGIKTSEYCLSHAIGGNLLFKIR